MWLDGTVTRKIFSKGTSVPANEPQGTFFDLEQILPDLRFSLVSFSPMSIFNMVSKFFFESMVPTFGQISPRYFQLMKL